MPRPSVSSGGSRSGKKGWLSWKSRSSAVGPKRTLALFLLALVGFNLRAVMLGVPPVLPAIRSDLHLSFTVAGALTSLPILCLGLAAVPGALLSNRLGPRLLIAAACTGIGVGGIMRILPPATLFLPAGTLLFALCIAAAQPAGSSVVRAWFPDNVQRASVIYTAGLNFGGTAATTISVYLLALGGWRGSFVIWSVVALCAAILWFWFAPRHEVEAMAAGHLRSLLRNRDVWRAGALFAAQSTIFFSAVTWIPFLLRSEGRNAIALVLFLLGGVVLLTTVVLALVRREFATSRWFYVGAGLSGLIGSAGFAFGFTGVAWLFAILLGIGTGLGFVGTMALPPLLAPASGEVAGYSALMLTGGYVLAFIGPFLGGFLLDLTGVLSSPFLVPIAGSLGIIVIGATIRPPVRD